MKSDDSRCYIVVDKIIGKSNDKIIYLYENILEYIKINAELDEVDKKIESEQSTLESCLNEYLMLCRCDTFFNLNYKDSKKKFIKRLNNNNLKNLEIKGIKLFRKQEKLKMRIIDLIKYNFNIKIRDSELKKIIEIINNR